MRQRGQVSGLAANPGEIADEMLSLDITLACATSTVGASVWGAWGAICLDVTAPKAKQWFEASGSLGDMATDDAAAYLGLVQALRRLLGGLNHVEMRSIGVTAARVTLAVKCSNATLVRQMQSPAGAAADREASLETLHLVASGLASQLQAATFSLAPPAAAKKAAALAAAAGRVPAMACAVLDVSATGSTKAWVNDTEVTVSNDWDARSGDAIALIDAAFLASLPPPRGWPNGGGKRALLALVDPAPLRLCVHPSAKMDILGALSEPLPVAFGGGGPGAGAAEVLLERVIVVRNLPVPLHLPLRRLPRLRDAKAGLEKREKEGREAGLVGAEELAALERESAGAGDARPSIQCFGGRPLCAEMFGEEYQTHPFWGCAPHAWESGGALEGGVGGLATGGGWPDVGLDALLAKAPVWSRAQLKRYQLASIVAIVSGTVATGWFYEMNILALVIFVYVVHLVIYDSG